MRQVGWLGCDRGIWPTGTTTLGAMFAAFGRGHSCRERDQDSEAYLVG